MFRSLVCNIPRFGIPISIESMSNQFMWTFIELRARSEEENEISRFAMLVMLELDVKDSCPIVSFSMIWGGILI